MDERDEAERFRVLETVIRGRSEGVRRKKVKRSFWVAPMVDASDHAFRILCKRYGADGSYTPMIHSKIFMESASVSERIFQHARDGGVQTFVGAVLRERSNHLVKSRESYTTVLRRRGY